VALVTGATGAGAGGPALTVVLPCHNRAQILRRALEAWNAQEGTAQFEVVAVDDGSDDGTPGVLAGCAPQRFDLRVTRLEQPRGPAHARNVAVAQARSPLLLFAGDDVVPSRNFVNAHLEAHARCPALHQAVLGKTVWPDDQPTNSLMRHIDGVGAQQFSYFHLRHGQVLDFRHFYTSNVSVKADLLRGIEPLFDTGFRYPAYEDVELAYRLSRQRRLEIHYTTAPLAFHYHYYTSRAFAARQERCGAMSIHFLEKHPELTGRWRRDRIDACRALSRHAALAPLVQEGAGRVWATIEESALALAGQCETLTGPEVDGLYFTLLEYFVLKGMIEGALPAEEAAPAWRTLAVVALGCHLAILADDAADVLPPTAREVAAGLQRAAAECEAVFARHRLTRTRLFQKVRFRTIPNA
jgi:GT2 family glycosyltransferase